MAGTGSGKTFIEGVISANFVKNYPTITGFIGANTYEQLNTSTLKGIRDVWRQYFGMIDGVHYVTGKQPPAGFNLDQHNFDRYDSIISFRNGAIIYKASLDNYKAHEGKEFGWAIVDETKDTKEEAIKEVVIHRLRQSGLIINGEEINPLYIGTTPAKVDWINEWFELDRWENEIASKIYEKDDYFHKEFSSKCITISSTYHNQDNLPTGHIAGLMQEHTDRDGKIKESGKRLIFANPFVKVGGEFYSSFDRGVHSADIAFLPDEPIHISYDFNVVPYITMTCWQIIHREKWWEVRCFDEFCLPSPNNTTERLTREFLRKYGNRLKAGLYFYGDPTGSARDTRSRRNDYDIIKEILRPHINNYSDRVRYKAPPVIARRDFANNIFDERYDIRILVGRNCKKMVADFEYLKEDADGKKMKTRTTDPDTGQSYEKYSHCVAKGTMVTTINGQMNIENIRIGDLVLTRKGFRRVLWSGISGKNKKVNTYKIGNRILKCTPDHRIYTLSGFREAQLLTRWIILCIFDSKKSCEKQSSTTELNSTDGQDGTIEGGLVKTESIFIGIFGNVIMERFLKSIMFITKMITTITIRLRILDVFRDINIFLNTMIDYLRVPKMKRLESLMNVQDQGLLNGITPMLVLNGTNNTHAVPLSGIPERYYAKSVEPLLTQELSLKSDFVQENAKVDTICELTEHWGNGMKQESVLSAKENSRHTGGVKHKLAVGNVELFSESIEPEVYNLHIDQQHEYFANGILVHNCSDAFDYFITEAFKTHFKQ